MLHQLDGKYICTFLKVYEQRNISRASVMLGYSQSTVTNHIQILEDTLACKLFYRTVNGVSPTEKGELFEKYASEFLELSEQLAYQLHHLQGVLRVKALESFCVTHLSNPIIQFLEQYSDVEIRLTTGFHQDIIDDVLNRRVEFGIVPVEPTSNNLSYTPIFEEEFVFVCAERIDEEQLLTRELRVIGFGNHCIYQSLANKVLIDNEKFDYRNIEYVSLEMIKQAVLSGAGIALVPKYAIQAELANNKMKILNLGKPIMIQHGIIELATKHEKEISDVFKLFMINYFAKLNKEPLDNKDGLS